MANREWGLGVANHSLLAIRHSRAASLFERYEDNLERESNMTGAETLDVARDAIWTIVVVSSPLMVIGLVVGVVVSLFQALTQIQEQTLIFVPKILAIFVTLLLALPFMADSMHSHMMRISSRIVGG